MRRITLAPPRLPVAARWQQRLGTAPLRPNIVPCKRALSLPERDGRICIPPSLRAGRNARR